MMWLPDDKKIDDMFSRFDIIPACDRQTDRHLASSALYIASHGKNRDYRPISRFISEMVHDRAIYLLLNANRNSYATYRMVPFPMTLSDRN